MNNNNSNNRGNNNNRRRGRGNRQGGGGGGQQLNRIDSRARGNAPQLLEKYRKLAQDAHLNGDRVQAEYYLQFADHYFRVTADSRVRQDEQRRPGERWEGGQGEESEDGNDFSVESDFPNFDQRYDNRGPREDRPRQDGPREPRRDAEETAGHEAEPSDGSDSETQPNQYEPPANPFVRDRGRGGLKPRRAPRAERDEADQIELNQTGLDPAMLPPAISAARTAETDDGDSAEMAKPRRGRPRKKPLDGDAGEALETVS